MTRNQHKRIKGIVSEVNKTLSYYEARYISVRRTPEIEREVCESFEQFVEARFNYECAKIPELHDLVVATEGRLFKLTHFSCSQDDLEKKRFSSATVTLLQPDLLLNPEESLIIELNRASEFLFGAGSGKTKITFNSVRKKINIKFS